MGNEYTAEYEDRMTDGRLRLVETPGIDRNAKRMVG